MFRAAIILAFVGGIVGVSAQAAGQSGPTFEVASVKPSGAAVSSGRVPPGQWRAVRSTLVRLIGYAYPQYAFENLVVGGPDWVRDARVDVDARMDPTTTPAQLAQMISQLLADRFKLRTHTEQRPVDVYVLGMSREDRQWGTQLKRSDASCVDAVVARQPLSPQCRETAASGLHYRVMQISDFSAC